jgi:hypothetical protein
MRATLHHETVEKAHEPSTIMPSFWDEVQNGSEWSLEILHGVTA